MPLVFLPDAHTFFLWGEATAPGTPHPLATRGQPAHAELVVPEGRQRVAGFELPLLATLAELAVIPTAHLESLSGSVAAWAVASKLGIELVSRERVVPTITRRGGGVEARWGAALSASEDAARVAALARSMPPAAHAVPLEGGAALDVWAPDALLRTYLDALVDALVRGPNEPHSSTRARSPRRKDGGAPPPADSVELPWERRWRSALTGPHSSFEARGFGERSLSEELERWSQAALGARDRLRACFRLELPAADREPFVLRFLLQSPDDPSLIATASEVWQASGRSLAKLGLAFRDPEESLLEALGRAARLFPPIEHALASPKPEALDLDAESAWAFLGPGAAALADAGFGVIIPVELTPSGQRRLRLQMRVGAKSKVAGTVKGSATLALDELLAVDWGAVIGDDPLTTEELVALAKQKAPLVRYRGAWVAVDPRELAEIQRRIARGPTQVTLRDAVQAALVGEARDGSLAAAVTAVGSFADVLDRLRGGASSQVPAPASLRAQLRPYQERGLGWLWTMASLGLGGCLADDMGLGKTVQLLAFLLRRAEEVPEERRPTLLVAPTSVLGNWEREIERFAPALDVARHYGPERARRADDIPTTRGAVVLTSYGILCRDIELLATVNWASVVLDEAQKIKNSASSTAHCARRLRAGQRFALTGTPVENRLAELWSILEFANPGLLGPLTTFRRELAVPIERYGDTAAAERLRRLVAPFLLRRLKTDTAVIADLPAKHEMKVICTLTREQATLYKAAVDEELRLIAEAEGISRRGRVLALLTSLKQICNHPAQYLGEAGPLAQRSGKLARVTEMLEEAIAAGDRALVFTQFREMGERLMRHLSSTLGCEVVFLHGGTSKSARDEMVRRFQEDARGPRVFLLSLKAGGTGLNLSGASHVFHFDRWWNPAVEDQATDRAYRIGQTRAVQVHKLVCAGTVEDKVDELLERKRKLAGQVMGSGEKWITEMPDSELRELFALSESAAVASDESVDDVSAPRPAPKKKRASARGAGRQT